MKRKIDRLVEYVAPVWAAKRKAAREILNIQATNYRGASTSRIFKNWSVSTVSPDAAVDGELETLRNASRDLNRNEAVAAGMTDTFTYNTVHTGLMPQSKIDHERIGITEEQATDFQTDAEEIYRRWQETASACGRMTFSEIQLLAARQIVESGEFFAIRRAIDQSWRPYFLSLEPVEADRIEFPAKNTEKNIRYGIEFGERGEPLRYSVRLRHPGDSFYHGPGNLLGFIPCIVAQTVGAIMAGAALDGIDLGTRYKCQHLFGLWADILHPLMTGNMPGHGTQALVELCSEQSCLVSV